RERSRDLRSEHAGAFHQLVQERRPLLLNVVGNGLGAEAGLNVVLIRRQRRPMGAVPARHERNRRGAQGTRPAVATIARSSGTRAQPYPRDAPRQTAIVEPPRLVTGEPRWQDLALPGGGRRLESFELRQDGIDGIRPLHARIGRHALPTQQEAQEIARRDRLDLCPYALDRVAVNAGEQAALAPFFAG